MIAAAAAAAAAAVIVMMNKTTCSNIKKLKNKKYSPPLHLISPKFTKGVLNSYHSETIIFQLVYSNSATANPTKFHNRIPANALTHETERASAPEVVGSQPSHTTMSAHVVQI